MSLPDNHFRYKGFIVRCYKDIVPYKAKSSRAIVIDGEQEIIKIDEMAMSKNEAIAKAKAKIDYYINEYNLGE